MLSESATSGDDVIYGLQVKNPSGEITLSVTDRQFRIVGVWTGTIAASSTGPLIPVDGLTADSQTWIPISVDSPRYVRALLQSGGFRVQNTDNAQRNYYIMIGTW